MGTGGGEGWFSHRSGVWTSIADIVAIECNSERSYQFLRKEGRLGSRATCRTLRYDPDWYHKLNRCDVESVT